MNKFISNKYNNNNKKKSRKNNQVANELDMSIEVISASWCVFLKRDLVGWWAVGGQLEGEGEGLRTSRE
jgi:hypothetical protein